MVDAGKIDRAILKQLYTVKGAQDASVIWWQTHLQEQLGQLPDYAEVVSAFKRLRAAGIVRLRKYIHYNQRISPLRTKQFDRLYEYRGGETDAVDSWFFGYASFETIITDEGRSFWDIPRAPIGFQMPA